MFFYIVSFLVTLASLLLANVPAHTLQSLVDFRELAEYVFGPVEGIQEISAPQPNGDFSVGGYWENYQPATDPGAGKNTQPSYYENDIKNIDRVYYAFLTLDFKPNPDAPNDRKWDGKCIYDSMTDDCVAQDILWPPVWPNPDAWMGIRVQALYQACKYSGKKFIWSLGGEADLRQGISDDQVDTFVTQVVKLLGQVGDGIDLNFEHLSDSDRDTQLATMGTMIYKLRNALNAANLSDKEIIFSAKYNAFWTHAPDGFTGWSTDGEGLGINDAVKGHGSSLGEAVDQVNIMFYDQNPKDIDAPATGATLESYKKVLAEVEKTIPKDKITMGFEPGPQWNNGVWEGGHTDEAVIDYMKGAGYGGVMFWAINQKPNNGVNTLKLAEYAKK